MNVLLKWADGVHSYDNLEQAQSKRAEIGGELFVPMAELLKQCDKLKSLRGKCLMADKLEFLRGKGLTVGMAKESLSLGLSCLTTKQSAILLMRRST